MLPMMPILASFTVTLFAAFFVFVCLLMMGLILIQKPRGGGLSGAFGGSGGSAQAAFGAKTGDVLTWGTVILFALFLILGSTLTLLISPSREVAPSTVDAPVGTTAPAQPVAPISGEPATGLPADTLPEGAFNEAPATAAPSDTGPMAPVAPTAPAAPTDTAPAVPGDAPAAPVAPLEDAR